MRLKSILAIAVTGLMLSSCLKTKDTYGLINDSGSIVSGIYSHYLSDPLVVSVNPAPPTETLDLLTVKFFAARGNQPKSDMQVTLALNPTLIADYNAANGTAFLAMPVAAYTLSDPSLVLTMAKGSEGSYTLKITVNKAALSLTSTYALGFSIQSVSEGVINQLEKSFLFVLGVKNKFDGVYTINGTMVDFANAGLTGLYPLEWEVATNGPLQNVVYDHYYFASPTPAHIINNGGSASYYGSFGLIINFDGSDNVASVTNWYGQPSGNGRSANLDPSGVNKYIAATKTVSIKYWMDQPSVITPHRTAFSETWVYSRAR